MRAASTVRALRIDRAAVSAQTKPRLIHTTNSQSPSSDNMTATGEQTTWAEWGRSLAGPAPENVPIVPGHNQLQKDWPSYGKAWGVFHNNKMNSSVPAPPPAAPPASSGLAETPPAPPTPSADASELDWATYGRFIGAYQAALNQTQASPAAVENSGQTWKEYAKALRDAAKKRSEESKGRGWASQGGAWSEYGRAVGEGWRDGPPSRRRVSKA